MNVILPQSHPRLLRFVSLVCLIGLGAGFSEAATYQFAKVADSSGPISEFRGTAINSYGEVVIEGYDKDFDSGVWAWSGGAIQQVASGKEPQFFLVGGGSIGDGHQVLFRAGTPTGGLELWRADLTTSARVLIADTSGPLSDFVGGTKINANGTAAFRAALDSGSTVICSATTGGLTMIAQTGATFTSLGTTADISLNNEVVFWGRTGTEHGIYRGNGTTLATIVDTSGPLSSIYDTPAINATGSVAFASARDAGGYGVYVYSGGSVTERANTDGPFNFVGPYASLNSTGDVAFGGRLDTQAIGDGGIFIGSDPTADTVLLTGDALFGSTLKTVSVFSHALNDAGQIVFYYRLTDGTTGVGVATPVPEPGAAGAILFGFCAAIASRRPRRLGTPCC